MTLGLGTPGNRPPGVMKLMSPQPANAVPFYDDFINSVIAPIQFGEGLVATPGTVVNKTYDGSPSWISTLIQGTGAVNLFGNSISTPPSIDSDAVGYCSIATGSTAGDGSIVDFGGRNNAGASNLIGPAFGLASYVDFVGAWRVSPSTITNLNFGFGWVAAGVNTGTNWVSDPSATITAGPSEGLVFTRHSSAYGSAAAGDFVARYFNASGVETDLTLAYADSTKNPAGVSPIATSKYIKVEVQMTKGLLNFYLNEIFIGSIPLATSTTKTGLRPSFGAISVSGAKSFRVDQYYQEIGPGFRR